MEVPRAHGGTQSTWRYPEYMEVPRAHGGTQSTHLSLHWPFLSGLLLAKHAAISWLKETTKPRLWVQLQFGWHDFPCGGRWPLGNRTTRICIMMVCLRRGRKGREGAEELNNISICTHHIIHLIHTVPPTSLFKLTGGQHCIHIIHTITSHT